MESVLPLVVVLCLTAGIGCLIVAAGRARRQDRAEVDELVAWLGARRYTPETGLPPGSGVDVFADAGPVDGDRPFDDAFGLEYRGRQIVAVGYTRALHSGVARSHTSRHVVQVLGVKAPPILVASRVGVARIALPQLTEVATGEPAFDARYVVLTDDPALRSVELPAAVRDWFLARPDPYPTMISFTGDRIEATGWGPLPGWELVGTIDDLVELADVVQYGASRGLPRLVAEPRSPAGNRALIGVGAGLAVLGLLVWIGGYTLTDPGGGLVVILVLGGLVGGAVLLNRWLERRKARGAR